MQNTQLPLLALMVIAGMFIPAMASLNATLGGKLGSPMFAVCILCLVASVAAVTLLVAMPTSQVRPVWSIHPIYYIAGILFVLYISSITYSAPRVGLGNAIFLVILGQLISAAVIDHNGWLGSAVSPLTLKRSAGLLFVAAGVYLAKSDVTAMQP